MRPYECFRIFTGRYLTILGPIDYYELLPVYHTQLAYLLTPPLLAVDYQFWAIKIRLLLGAQGLLTFCNIQK